MEEKTFPFEIKALTEEGTFEGYAAIFDKPDALGEIIEPGAFNKTLKGKKSFPMLWYHDPRNPIGTAEVEVDEKGLKVAGKFDLNVQSAREKYSLMKSKAIKGLSFGFNTVKDLWEGATRFLKEVKLFEISPVTFGAHDKAKVLNVKQWTEEKPFPNEHSARLKSPNLFDEKTFRRKSDGTVYGKIKVPATAAVIWAKLKGSADPSDQPQPQAIIFPTKNWTAAQAKAWLKDNNVKYERFEAASKSLEGAIEFLEEMKSNEELSEEKATYAVKAIAAMNALLDSEPPSGTQDEGKGILAPIVEALEPPSGTDKPHEHLFASTIKALENPNLEEKEK